MLLELRASLGEFMGYKTEKIIFKGFQGHQMVARLEVPETEIKTYAIFAHCFTCSKDVHAATRISRALTDHGVAVLRFDFTGLGNSDGDFSNTNFSTNVADLVCAYEYLTQNHHAPEIIIGHSLGGAAVLASANSMPAVKVVATIGAPSDVAHVEKLMDKKVAQIEKEGEAQVNLGGRNFVIKKQFLDDIRSITMEYKIKNLRASLIILHSPDDQIVSIENAYEIFNQAQEPKSMISLKGASHLLDREEDSTFVAKTIALLCERYLRCKECETDVMTEEEKLDQEAKESFPASDPPGHMSKSSVDSEHYHH
jgi:alpha/beta superfamily hydrolase